MRIDKDGGVFVNKFLGIGRCLENYRFGLLISDTSSSFGGVQADLRQVVSKNRPTVFFNF